MRVGNLFGLELNQLSVFWVGADNDGGGNKELPTRTIGSIVKTDQLFFSF